MQATQSGFTVEINGTSKHCPAGEKAGDRYIKEGNIPVLSCEGGCIRGEIARIAAHLVAKEEPYRRGCHGELLTVPGSALATWMKTAEKVVLIDGCFLHCHGRVLENLIAKGKLAQFDALSYYRRYNENFDIDEVPEADRNAAARLVADAVLAELGRTAKTASGANAGCGATIAPVKGTGCGCA
jgi:DGC domain